MGSTVCVALGAWLVAACSEDPAVDEPSRPYDAGTDACRDTGADPVRDAAPASSVPITPAFCARRGDDAVRDLFCGPRPPAISSVHDLRAELQLLPPPDEATGESLPSESAAGYVAVLAHSTALSGHLVSPINPRVIVLSARTVMAYQRGVQRIELAARAIDTGGFNFYLLDFTQACNARPGGCAPGDLYTPNVESDWTALEIRDDEELKNTALDCRQCHRRGRERAALLMRELEAPWTHFMAPLGATDGQPGDGASDLLHDYVNAKGDELYAGLALHTISAESAFRLQVAVGEQEQPLIFDAPTIDDERWPYGAEGYPAKPQPSPTWERGYEAFKRGEQLALPYLEPRAVDRTKQARLSEAYQRYRAGELDAAELPDLGDVFPDDPALRARIGLTTEPDATAVAALIQACGSCHNDVLDQSLSRARFNIDVSRLQRAEIEAAIARVERPRDAPGAMPPPEARQLAPGVRERVVAYLKDSLITRSRNARLVRAAALGMAGGALPLPARD